MKIIGLPRREAFLFRQNSGIAYLGKMLTGDFYCGLNARKDTRRKGRIRKMALGL
jgi:hypothetical protein